MASESELKYSSGTAPEGEINPSIAEALKGLNLEAAGEQIADIQQKTTEMKQRREAREAAAQQTLEEQFRDGEAGRVADVDRAHTLALRSESARKGAATRRLNSDHAEALLIDSQETFIAQSPEMRRAKAEIRQLEQIDARRAKIAERLGHVTGLTVDANNPRLDELRAQIETTREASIRAYADTILSAVEKVSSDEGGVVRETLRGNKLGTIEDLRSALGVEDVPVYIDSDRKSITQFFESDIIDDANGGASGERVMLVERIDRKTGRIVEASIVRGENLLRANHKGEITPTKQLLWALENHHTDTSYREPTEHATSHIRAARDESGDLGMVGAIMRHRGASDDDIDHMRDRHKRVRPRKSWWQRALESARRI